MQSAASIRDAERRLEEAAAVFRMKSRNAQEEFGDLSAQWSDARSRRFTSKHLDAQRDLMEQGARLCQLHGALVDSARAAAQEAEQEIAGFFAAQTGYESGSEAARHSTGVARDQATRSSQDCAASSKALAAINQSIAAAAVDPGW
jgi:hypothetical protein